VSAVVTAGGAWLVTGGAGFIGGNFVRRLSRETTAPIVVLDALTYAGNASSIADVLARPHVALVKAALLDALFARHDFTRVVHLAAESHVDRSIVGPQPFLRTNVDGTFQLLEAARRHWTTPNGPLAGRRLLHVSTDEVFGDLAPNAPPFTEASPYAPSSPYAASKASADLLVRAWHRTYGVPVLISNCSNNYGPWQFPEKLIPLTILNALEGRELPVYGDGRQRRDWLHVEDHCAALLAIVERGRVGETYVVGGGDERENIDVVRAVCRAVDEACGGGRAAEGGESAARIRHVADRAGHDRRYAIDATKIRRELGWAPRHSIDEALPALVRWYVEHRDWCDAVRSGEYRRFYDEYYAARLGGNVTAPGRSPAPR